MSIRLKNKVAIVTGASKGIGAGIARALAAAGASVVVNYARDQEGAERVVAELVRADGRAVAVQADVSKAADVARLYAETRKAFGVPGIVVNNAGVYDFAPLEDVSAAEFHRQFDTNVLGALQVIQEGVKHFGDAGASVINVSSIVSTSSGPGTVVYAATKAALDSLTRVLARELGPRKIRVNSIGPGPTETEGAHAAGLFGSPMLAQLLAATPLGRYGQPADMGPAAVFLASDEAAWITGEFLRVAGGLR
jgi:3-oxoacyl-[acyl-carrier protein] reductase